MNHIDFMNDVKSIESQIMEEITDAQKYMGCSDHWKGAHPTISANYADLAKQEIEHAKKLQDMLPLIKGSEEFTDEQQTIIKFLVDMNADQIRRVSSK